MKQLNKAIEQLVQFDLKNRKNYQSMQSSVGFFDGVWWIGSILVTIAFVIYNGWFFIWELILRENMTTVANPKTNKIMLILFGISVVLAIIEKIKIIKESGRNRSEKKRIAKERAVLLHTCDAAAKECGKEIYPFWQKFNGLTYTEQPGNDVGSLIVLPEKPIAEDQYGQYVADGSTAMHRETGAGVRSIIDFWSKHRGSRPAFFSEKIVDGKKYYIGSLYRLQTSSAEFSYTEENTDEKEKQVKAYKSRLDEVERTYNLHTAGSYKTNEDMYLEGKHSHSSFALDQLLRDEKIRRFRDNTVGTLTTHTKNEGMYYFYLWHQGWIVVDETCQKVVGVIFENDNHSCDWHLLTTDPVPGIQCRIEKNYAKVPGSPERTNGSPNKEWFLRSLPKYKLAPMDLTIPKPENVTDVEWGLWIYSHYTNN